MTRPEILALMSPLKIYNPQNSSEVPSPTEFTVGRDSVANPLLNTTIDAELTADKLEEQMDRVRDEKKKSL